MTHILDAGPMIAFLDHEPGAPVVRELLVDNPGECFAHVLNLCEIYYIYYCRGGEPVAEDALRQLTEAGVLVREDSDVPFWKAAAMLKGKHALSLPDAFCVALTQRLGGTAVTTDHGEFDPLVPLNYYPVLFIR